MSRMYYTPLTDEQFTELQKKAIEIWSTMGSEPTYSQEKINSIKDIQNVRDNFMYMVAMFDMSNQRKLATRLTKETKQAVRERMIEGGQPPEYVVF